MSRQKNFSMLDVIRKKRDGLSLTKEDIQGFISTYTEGLIPDYQASALLMAMFLQGLSNDELLCLTETMMNSGQTIDLSSLHGPKIDKHSTGGVGDKISIPLAPAVAACGVFVPMMSGRGLGHTGGTLDKLESIPGYTTQLSVSAFISTLRETGMSMIGQTEQLVPADKKLYALRDVTGTVESIPLISASIMSKKLAEGIDGLVLDVKVGSGALIKTLPESRELAKTLISIGKGAGKKVSAFITNMDEPLGRLIGNAAEINESIEVLRGKGEPDVRELTCLLGGEMLRLSGIASTVKEGAFRIAEVLDNGKALEIFAKSSRLQGAKVDLSDPEDPWFLHNVHKNTYEILAPETGYVTKIDAEAVGLSGISLGIGRMKKEDDIDPAAFIYMDKKCGEFVSKGERLCHFAAAADLPEERLWDAQMRLQNAYTLSSTKAPTLPLVYEVLS